MMANHSIFIFSFPVFLSITSEDIITSVVMMSSSFISFMPSAIGRRQSRPNRCQRAAGHLDESEKKPLPCHSPLLFIIVPILCNACFRRFVVVDHQWPPERAIGRSSHIHFSSDNPNPPRMSRLRLCALVYQLHPNTLSGKNTQTDPAHFPIGSGRNCPTRSPAVPGS